MPTIVDLRSDTITKPTSAMLAAMERAELGDDVLGDDPTVERLERRMAELTGKEAALFVPSGTMANLLAIRSVCEPGDEIIADESTHFFNYETGGFAALAGCSMRPARGPRGIFTPDDVRGLYRPMSDHFARSRMVVVENTCNRGGGSVWTRGQFEAMRAVCDEFGMHLHLDGARLWNAVVKTGAAVADYTRHVDTVSMCFSKGLGAPAGSILAGPAALIERAHRFRKMLGGAMRQAGLLAGAALHAIEHHVERLADDHANARRLAEGIARLPGITLDAATVETNIVYFEVDPALMDASAFGAALEREGVRVLTNGPRWVRAVTHLDVGAEQIGSAIAAFERVCAARSAR